MSTQQNRDMSIMQNPKVAIIAITILASLIVAALILASILDSKKKVQSKKSEEIVRSPEDIQKAHNIDQGLLYNGEESVASDEYVFPNEESTENQEDIRVTGSRSGSIASQAQEENQETHFSTEASLFLKALINKISQGNHKHHKIYQDAKENLLKDIKEGKTLQTMSEELERLNLKSKSWVQHINTITSNPHNYPEDVSVFYFVFVRIQNLIKEKNYLTNEINNIKNLISRNELTEEAINQDFDKLMKKRGAAIVGKDSLGELFNKIKSDAKTEGTKVENTNEAEKADQDPTDEQKEEVKINENDLIAERKNVEKEKKSGIKDAFAGIFKDGDSAPTTKMDDAKQEIAAQQKDKAA